MYKYIYIAFDVWELWGEYIYIIYYWYANPLLFLAFNALRVIDIWGCRTKGKKEYTNNTLLLVAFFSFCLKQSEVGEGKITQKIIHSKRIKRAGLCSTGFLTIYIYILYIYSFYPYKVVLYKRITACNIYKFLFT